MGNIHEVGLGAGGYPRVPTLWIPQPIGSPRVSASLERPISSLDTVMACCLSISPRVYTKILKTSTSVCQKYSSAWGQATYM